MTNKKLPTYFISHGGGPWPWLKEEMPFFETLETSLQQIPKQLGRPPKAILMVSGHWEEKTFAVMGNPQPPMLYDYHGFPEQTYKIIYPAPGMPELAHDVQTLLQNAGFPTQIDTQRGFDHGAFVPAFSIYPDATAPMIQLSLNATYDPETHLKAGRALAPLRDRDILIIGSGLSYHNLRAMMTRNPAAETATKQFDAWLQTTLLHSSPAERWQRLCQWSEAPSARQAHPQEDHLLPLMVALGAAEHEPATLVYHENAFMGHITASSFGFGLEPTSES